MLALGGTWLPASPARDEPCWEIARKEFVGQATPFITELPDCWVVALDVYVGHAGYAKVINQILGNDPDEFASLAYRSFSARTPSRDAARSEFLRLMQQLLTDLEHEDLAHHLDRFRSERPDAPLMAQIHHLAALAWTADFARLDDYLQLFKRGKRLNFVPHISLEMIDRAVDIAAERTS